MEVVIEGDSPIGAEDTKKDVLALSKEILTLIHHHFPTGPVLGVKPIHILHGNIPMVDVNRLPTCYCIHLTCLHSRKYNQIVYQLAHELCHVFISPLLIHPLAEILAVTISLVLLQEVGNLWTHSTIHGKREYAPSFGSYRHAVAARAVADVNISHGMDVERWFKIEVLGETKMLGLEDRSKQIVAALVFEPCLLQWSNWTQLQGLYTAVEESGKSAEVCSKEVLENWMNACMKARLDSNKEIGLMDDLIRLLR